VRFINGVIFIDAMLKGFDCNRFVIRALGEASLWLSVRVKDAIRVKESIVDDGFKFGRWPYSASIRE
jgi:hypothetical protein